VLSTQQQEQPPPAAAPTSQAPPPTSAPPTSSPPPTTSASPTPTPGQATDPVTFVQEYYRMLPDDIDGAFARLSPEAQSQSQGIESYREFYSGMRTVYAENLRNAGPNTVTATVVFLRTNGTESRENYRFVVGTDEQGNQVLQSFSQA